MGSCTKRAPVEEVYGSAGHDSQSADAASTQTVHLTIAMLIERAPETRQTMCIDGNHCCVQQTLLRYKCLRANTSEIDLTSGEQFPWKQLFLNVPLDEAQKVIGEGITKFTFRLLSEKHCFEITCLDGMKWLVVQRYAVPKRIADDERILHIHKMKALQNLSLIHI